MREAPSCGEAETALSRAPMRRSSVLTWVLAGSVLIGIVTSARALDWGALTTPSSSPPRVIGGFGGACITGAVPLPLEGAGFQAEDVRRNRYFGHPDLIAYIVDLGRRAAEAGLGALLIGDMAQPRGGPMTGHVSHQSGLDVDVSFRLDVAPLPREARAGIERISFVSAETGEVDPALWTDHHAELVRLATTDPRVSRVFVDAAIKRDLCGRAWPERSWLRRVRTWPRHADHIHVRLRCPAGSPECREQAPLPPGEGCSGVTQPPLSQVRRTPRTSLPEPCRVLLQGS